MELIYEILAILWAWKAWILAGMFVLFGCSMLKKMGEELTRGVFRALWWFVKILLFFRFKNKEQFKVGDRVIVDGREAYDGTIGNALHFLPNNNRWVVDTNIYGKVVFKTKHLHKLEKEQ